MDKQEREPPGSRISGRGSQPPGCGYATTKKTVIGIRSLSILIRADLLDSNPDPNARIRRFLDWDSNSDRRKN